VHEQKRENDVQIKAVAGSGKHGARTTASSSQDKEGKKNKRNETNLAYRNAS